MANFGVRVFTEGELVVEKEIYSFYVDAIGYYIKDSYDFVDKMRWPSQPLGFWGFRGMAGLLDVLGNSMGVERSSIAMLQADSLSLNKSFENGYQDIQSNRYFAVKNSDFISYRQNFNVGGDYTVFSDVLYERLGRIECVRMRR